MHFCSVFFNKQKHKAALGKYIPYETQENIYSPTSTLDDDKRGDTATPKKADMHAIEMTGFKNPMMDEVSQRLKSQSYCLCQTFTGI